MLGPHKQSVTSTELVQALFYCARHWQALKAGIKHEGRGRQDLDGKADGVGRSLVPVPMSSSTSPNAGSPQVSPAPWLVAAHPSHCIQWVYGGGIEKSPLLKATSFSKMQISRLYLFNSLVLQVVSQQEEFGSMGNHQQHCLELGPSPIFPNTKIISRWKIRTDSPK